MIQSVFNPMKIIYHILCSILIACFMGLTPPPAHSSCAISIAPMGIGENGGKARCQGAPGWTVNMVNANHFVTDTPLWYEPAIGPPVEITLNFNSQDSAHLVGLFGRGWRFNYGYGSRFGTVDAEGWFRDIFPPPPPGNGAAPPAAAVDAAEIVLPSSRIIKFMDTASSSDPRAIPKKNTYDRFYGELRKLDADRYELETETGTVYSYEATNLSVDAMSWTDDSLYEPVFSPRFSRLTAVTDRYGNGLTFEHEGLKPTKIIDAQGRQTTISYNGRGLISRIEDPFGRTASFEYDDQLFLTKITDMNGYWTEFEYGRSTGRPYEGVETEYVLGTYVTAMRNSRGVTTFYHERGERKLATLFQPPYPAPGEDMLSSYRLTVTHPDNAKEEFYYCGPFGYGWHVSPEHYTAYVDEHRNNYADKVPKTLYYYGATAKGPREQIGKIITPEGHIRASYQYDPLTQNILSTTNAKSQAVKFTYNPKGRVATVTDPLNRVTTYTYKENQLDLASVSSGLGTIEFEYNANRDLTLIRDRREETAATGDVPTGLGTRETAMAYNSHGLLTSITDPGGILTRIVYGTDLRPVQILRDGRSVAAYIHDTAGRVISATDAAGLTLNYDHDDLNRVTRITWPDNRYETMGYSACCPWLMERITDRTGRTTYFTYDDRKNLTAVTEPAKSMVRYRYDKNRRLTAILDRNRNITRFSYDRNGRLIQKTDHEGASRSFAWDSLDRLVRRTNARGVSAEYEYNVMGAPVCVTYSDTTPEVRLTYDGYDRITGISDGSGTSSYTYFADASLRSADGPLEADTLTYAYDILGRTATVTPESGEALSFVYDSLDRLTKITAGTRPFTYGYEGADPLVRSLTRPNAVTTAYDYDGEHRMAGITNTGPAGLISSHAYTRNDRGLIDKETIDRAGSLTALTEGIEQAVYNSLNQQTGEDLAHDADGNLVRGVTLNGHAFTADYDGENRLTAIRYTGPEGVIHETVFTYACTGFLAGVKTFADHAPVSDTRILRSGFLPLQDRDRDNQILRQYTWGLNPGGGIGGLLEMRQGGESFNYLYDGRGNVTALVDATAAPVASYQYDAFGRLTAGGGSLKQPFRFSTKRYFDGPGLSYYGYRFYQPGAGRWLNRDPLGEAGGLNLYGFVENNPINLVDPFGLWSVTADVYPLGFGGGLIVGQNLNGDLFLTGRAGFGGGGGISWDKDGTSPDPCISRTGPKVASFGFYAEGNLSILATLWGFYHNVGVSVTENREIFDYNNTGPTSGNSLNLGLRGSLAAGIEGSLNIKSFLNYLGF